MRINNLFLFILPALIWGSTWFVIKFQLGSVPPLYSVSYRFFLASLILLAYSKIAGLNLKFNQKQHARIALQGLLLFGLNYWLVYWSEQYLSSGLVAIFFSTLVFMNIFFSALILKTKIEPKVILGAVLGFGGTILIFYPELARMSFEGKVMEGLIVCTLSVISASLGNITSASNQKFGLPVIQTNAFGMLYGSLMMLTIALVTGANITFDTSTSYIVSLSYLVVFGSVIAFGAYLTLVGKVGASVAGYVIVAVPVIALTISYFFEDYQLTYFTVIGIILIISGNFIVLKK